MPRGRTIVEPRFHVVSWFASIFSYFGRRTDESQAHAIDLTEWRYLRSDSDGISEC